MKSYWIVAVVLSSIAWHGSKAHAFCPQQLPSDGQPVQQAQASSSPTRLGNSVHAVTVKPPVPPAGATATPSHAAGEAVKPKSSYMLVELSKTLKANKLKVGDKINAEVVQDVVARGKVIIPIETKLTGHVTEVSAKDSSHAESRLGIVFDKILLKHHHDINFQAVVQAVAPPAPRKSRVDEPSQMLPPSMMGGGKRDSGQPSGRGNTNSGRSSGAPSGSSSASLATLQAPITVKQSPSNHVEASGALLEIASTGKPISIGVPQGVIGLKGLNLSSEPGPNTPGPVIVSNTDNVKLDYGTQLLLHVLRVEVPASAEPVK
ncbi:MAG TPA: hypothetical protein VGP65_12620 [Candidatus Angelobacter sp.]|nr:hypothetical protein [Candidatus Angelobacter sp.]